MKTKDKTKGVSGSITRRKKRIDPILLEGKAEKPSQIEPIRSNGLEIKYHGHKTIAKENRWSDDISLQAQQTMLEAERVAKMVGSHLSISGLNVNLLRNTDYLSDVRIAFAGMNTLYDWGSLLNLINQDPILHYFGNAQSSTTITELGSDPLVPSSYYDQSQIGVWGNIVFNILEIGCSSRYGGSMCVVLSPTEDCGIELMDNSNNIAIDLHDWILKVYVQPSLHIFNRPFTPQTNSLRHLIHCELEIHDSEAYQLNGLLPLPSSVTQADIDNLIRQAENQAVTRMIALSRFLNGWMHYTYFPNFNRTVETLDRIHISNGSCNVEMSNKTPQIAALVKIDYLFLSEGLFDNSRELNAEPVIEFRTPPLHIATFEKERYIGNAQSTGWMYMGYLPIADFTSAHEINLWPGWTEYDPISDDEGGHLGIKFEFSPDSDLINQRITAQQPGQLNDTLYALENDQLIDWTTYAIEIRFDLVWR